jgi:hypothetical protein
VQSSGFYSQQHTHTQRDYAISGEAEIHRSTEVPGKKSPYKYAELTFCKTTKAFNDGTLVFSKYTRATGCLQTKKKKRTSI